MKLLNKFDKIQKKKNKYQDFFFLFKFKRKRITKRFYSNLIFWIIQYNNY